MGGFAALERYPQFIIWEAIPLENGDVKKVPVHQITRRAHDAHDPAIWMPATDANAIAAVWGKPYGVGFTFTAEDPFFFIDIDNCAVTGGQWSPFATEMCAIFPGAAVEVSQSGRGIHIIGTGRAPAPRRIKAGDLFDLYTERRFVALSGRPVYGDAATVHDDALAHVVRRWLTPKAGTGTPATEWTVEPVPEWTGPVDDDDLIARARRAASGASVFGTSVSFDQLWVADADALGDRWPDDHGMRPYDANEVDASLAQHLAFWTGNNCERIRSLMQRSALRREKWDARPEYLERTILRAVGLQTTVYTGVPGGTSAVDRATAGTPGIREGYQFMPVPAQVEYFAGCTYVQNIHRALVPGGELLKPVQFKAAYGGYQFAWDNTRDTKSTRNAWEAFTESQGFRFPKVTGVRFLPRVTPGEIIETNGLRYINSYVPKWGARRSGDPGPFLEHLERLLPDESDREVLLSYLAACVQQMGAKAQWCPVVQGMEGNGKTVMYSVMEYAIGADHCHQLNPRDVDNKFNAWIEGKLLVGVEEIRVAGKWELADVLKPLITNRRVPLQGKNEDQRTGDNCANFLMFSNHKDAVLKTNSDRRYCVLYTAQQDDGDLERDGLDKAYFKSLYDWIETDGAAITAEYLWTRPVTVDILGRAPKTTSTAEAIVQSYGLVEQTIIQAVDLDEPGFRGDLICTRAVDSLLRNLGKRLSPHATRIALERVGYVRHPALESAQGKVRVDGVRRRLYVRQGSVVEQVQSAAVLADQWRRVNSGAVGDEGTVGAGVAIDY